jgi:predicted nucleic acid-binding protein
MARPEAVPRLKRLLESVSTVDAPHGLKLPDTIRLDPKDQPILLAAIHDRADYLLTGDASHFGHLYGKRIEGLLVLRPARYSDRRGRA